MTSARETEPGGTVVMVCGAARSGTTMLDLMLGNSDDAFSCGEVYAWFRPFRQHHFAPVCTCGDPDCAVWRDFRDIREDEFHRTALKRPGIRFVVDSSKDLRWVLDTNVWLNGTDVRVANVLIWKDPIDLAYSHWKRGRPIDYFRRQFCAYYERFLALDLDFIGVSYTALVRSPERVLPDLCAAVGMDYSTGREAFWNKSHHHCFGSAGTASQVGAGRSAVQLQRDFPDDFQRDWERYTRRRGVDTRLDGIIRQLEASQLGARPAPAWSTGVARRNRPAWYYRHVLKAAFRRRFPERTPVTD